MVNVQNPFYLVYCFFPMSYQLLSFQLCGAFQSFNFTSPDWPLFLKHPCRRYFTGYLFSYSFDFIRKSTY